MHAATLTAVVVLPTPPFWFAIAYTVPIRGHGTGGVGRTRSAVRRRSSSLNLDFTLRVAACGPFLVGGGTPVASVEPLSRRRGGARPRPRRAPRRASRAVPGRRPPRPPPRRPPRPRRAGPSRPRASRHRAGA